MIRNALMVSVLALIAGLASACGEAASQTGSDALPPGEAHPELGKVTTITPAMVARAAGLVTEGKVYALGVVTGPDTPTFPGRSFSIQTTGSPVPIGANRLTAHDDRLETHVGIGSQLDGLGHIGRDGVHYGGHRREDIFTENGLTKLSTDAVPPIATRGVLINMAKHFGVEQLAPLTGFGREDIIAAALSDGLEFRPGDVVLFHTGWLAMADEDPAKYIDQQPGLTADGAEFLAEQGVVAVGADNAGLETMAFEDDILFPVHQILLVDHGIYILEAMDTSGLAADRVSEFFFVLGQPRFKGAVQAVINPVAIR